MELINHIKTLGFTPLSDAYKDDESFKVGDYLERYWQLPKENYLLQGTNFFENQENDFIHFTSIEAFNSIISNGTIRLYNLLNMDDKLELYYAKKELNLSNLFDEDKKELYCLSMCSAKENLDGEMKEHLLWNLHGRKGSGVIIRFSFANDLSYWFNFHLSKVLYNLEILNPLKELASTTKKDFLDSKICAFFKSNIYQFENETRLVFDNRPTRRVTLTDPQGKLLYPITYPDKFNSTDDIFYFQLPIWNFNKKEELFNAPNVASKDYKIPKIQIDEVILGYRYSEKDRINIEKRVKAFDNNIHVKITSLSKYY